MQLLTESEAEDWLPNVGVKNDLRGDLGFPEGKNLVVRVPLPDKPYRIPYLTNLLLTGAYIEPFAESLLWFVDWGMWSQVNLRVGYKLIQSIRADYRPLIEVPAHLFSATEEVEAQSLLVVPILMGWDAYFIPVTGKYFVFTSHHDFIDVVSRDDETHQRFLKVLGDDWGGKEY